MKKYNEFILEKRIAQISSKIEVTFGFDIIKTNHVEDRSNFSKRGLKSDNQNHISNAEMSEFVRWFKDDISKSIVLGEIVDGTEFVIKSKERELSMALICNKVNETYWKIIIKTVFRESGDNQFKIGKNQLCFEK